MITTHTVRNDVVSTPEKIMTEKSCTYFGETFGWKRELISDEKYKKIYKHTTPKGFIFFTYIGMKIEHSNNLFVNIDVWNEYYGKNILIVLSDLRKFCLATGSAFHADPYIHAKNEGRREVFERIRSYVNVSENEIYQLTERLETEDD